MFHWKPSVLPKITDEADWALFGDWLRLTKTSNSNCKDEDEQQANEDKQLEKVRSCMILSAMSAVKKGPIFNPVALVYKCELRIKDTLLGEKTPPKQSQYVARSDSFQYLPR